MPARWLDPGPVHLAAAAAATPVQPSAALALAAAALAFVAAAASLAEPAAISKTSGRMWEARHLL